MKAIKEKWNQLIEKHGKNKVYGACAAIVVAIILIIVLIVVLISGNNKKENDAFSVNKYTYTVELGENIDTDVNNYIELKDDEIDVNDVKFMFCGLKDDNASCEDYTNKELKQKVGKYAVKITYEDQSEELIINVKDTVAPKFTEFEEEIKLPQSKSETDLEKYFKAEDKSNDVKIKVSSSSVKFNTPGTYTIEVTASDPSGNKISKKAKVIIEKTEEPEDPNTGDNGETTEPEDVCPGGTYPSMACDFILTDYQGAPGYAEEFISKSTEDAEVAKIQTKADNWAKAQKKGDDDFYLVELPNGEVAKFDSYQLVPIYRNDHKCIGYAVVFGERKPNETSNSD